MTAIENKLARLELRLMPSTTGITYAELGFYVNFQKRWSDINTAPRFAVAEYQRLAEFFRLRKERDKKAEEEAELVP